MVERLAGFEQERKRAPRFAMRGVLAALQRLVRPLLLNGSSRQSWLHYGIKGWYNLWGQARSCMGRSSRRPARG